MKVKMAKSYMPYGYQNVPVVKPVQYINPSITSVSLFSGCFTDYYLYVYGHRLTWLLVLTGVSSGIAWSVRWNFMSIIPGIYGVVLELLEINRSAASKY